MTASGTSRSAKSRKWLGRLLVITLSCLALIAGGLWWLDCRERPYRELRKAVGEIQMVVERFAVDTEGAYPTTIEAAYARRHAQLPDNPFGPGRVKLLKPGDPWQPGGVVYVGMGPIIAAGEADGKPVQFSKSYPWFIPGEKQMHPELILPTEIDQYLLVAYAPRSHPGLARARIEWERQHQYSTFDARGKNDQLDYISAPGIDWAHVAMMKTAGEDYVPND